MIKLLIVFFVLTLSLNTTNILADTNIKLQKILDEIKSVQTDLTQENNTKENLQQQLKSSETSIGNLAKQLQETKKQLNQENADLQNLTKEQQEYQNDLSKQREVLAIQLRTAYMSGHQEYLKLLLNQQNPNIISRMTVYYDYINKQRIQRINKINETMEKIQINQQEIEKQKEALLVIQTKQKNQRDAINEKQKNRQNILLETNNRIKTKDERLRKLVEDKESLQHVLINVDQSNSFSFSASTPFSRLKGKLSWPTRGIIINHFGEPIEQSELTWNGVLIKANDEQPVYAIASGRVVFANWLPEYGLLLIISHGDGYMSLYGRNYSLYTNTGDTVAAGQMIATVGRSGGHSQSGLYFGIRHDGKAINPESWCH